MAATQANTGNRLELNHGTLTEVFVEWLQAFDAQKPTRPNEKEAYVGFAAGLMLRALIRRAPVTVGALAADADLGRPAYFWPEGYLYVSFCLNIRGRVLESDFQATQTLSPILNEARTWHSFRENVAEDPSLAIAFLDLFAGDEPQWSAPSLFQSGQVKPATLVGKGTTEPEG